MNLTRLLHPKSTAPYSFLPVHSYLKEKGLSFEDENVYVLNREDRWFERVVKEAIYVKVEQPSLNRGGGRRHQQSATYNAILKFLPRKLNHSSHLGSCETSNSHDDRRE